MGNLTSPKFPEDEIPCGGVLHPEGLILGGLPKPAASLDLLMDPVDLGSAGADIDAVASGATPRSIEAPDYTVGPIDMPRYHFYPDRLEVDHALLGEPRVQALMATIRGREGPQYDVLHGGGRFNDYSRHPDILVNGSTAAGAYQFNYPT